MIIYNLINKIFEKNISSINNEKEYLIIVNPIEFLSVNKVFDLPVYNLKSYSNVNENIKFESYKHYNFMSYIYFEIIDNEFSFEKINSYYGKKFVVIVIDDNKKLNDLILTELNTKNFEKESLAFIYYKFLKMSLSKMFDSLCEYEMFLVDTEMQLIKTIKNYDFEKVMLLKSKAYEIKKYFRYFLYIGDQIIMNENFMIPQKDLKYFKNIDLQINRIYEFSECICEKIEHLMDLYNSAVNNKTNNLINKLTIFTVFATPLTVISGIYGMNFVNMPELKHEQAYFVVLGVMMITTVVIYFILKKIKLL